MLFERQTIKVETQVGGLAELRFERGEAVNKLAARCGFGSI
jgi:hypothetical protein